MTTIEEEFWTDSAGRRVPLSLVKPEDQLKDELVRRIVAEALDLQKAMQAFKQSALSEALAAKGLIFERYSVTIGGEKGNISFRTFDGTLEMQVAVGERISFGPELQAAKAIIDECIEDWSAGGNANIRALVEHAFQVNQAGRIDTGRVLGLRKLSMKGPDGEPDPRWIRAMDAISDAVRVDGSQTYVRFYRRDPATGRMEAISLNIATL